MTHRIPVALATALALSGCILPMSGKPGATGSTMTGNTVTMQARVAKVQTMTRTFSVAKNPGLSKAATSFKELATALQSAFASSSGAVSRRPGAYSVEEAVTSVRAAGMKATYQVTGMAEHGDAWAISVPTVTVGSDFYTKYVFDADRVLLPFRMGGSPLYVELILMKR